jgi:hypothetical protein
MRTEFSNEHLIKTDEKGQIQIEQMDQEDQHKLSLKLENLPIVSQPVS